MKTLTASPWIIACLLPLGLTGCPDDKGKADLPPAADLGPAVRVASARILDRTGAQIGAATFTEQADKRVAVLVRITKAAPGQHGLHIHAGDKCEASDGGVAEDFLSAQGHFNPGGKMHGDPAQAERHAGDFGNLSVMLVGQDGQGQVSLVSDALSLQDGAANSPIGKAIIFHEKEDDLKTQPTGNSGARLGCGLIEAGGK